MIKKLPSFFLAIFYFSLLEGFGQPGSLDPTFGNGGKAVTNFLTSQPVYETGGIGKIQPNGKIVVAGSSINFFGFIKRFNSDGSIDNSFDGDGRLDFISFGINDIIIQQDGKILAAGGFSFDGVIYGLIRLNDDGSFDNSFDGDGKVITNSGSLSLALQSDGKIVVSGQIYNGANSDFSVYRYNNDGSLDNSFDGDGRLTTDIASQDDIAYSAAIQSDGKIVVAGEANHTVAMTRYNSDGSLDNSFDSDGKLTTDIVVAYQARNFVAVQNDSKIIVTGHNLNLVGNTYDYVLARYNSDGSQDNSFDDDGRLTTTISAQQDDFVTNPLVIQGDGKILVCGFTNNGGFEHDFAVARYNSDGSPDNSFDGDGKAVTDFELLSDFAHSVALQADGKILVAGDNFDNGNSPVEVVLARYNNDGSLDNSFDQDGKLSTSGLASSDDKALSIAIQSDGKIVVAGQAYNGVNTDFAVSRYNRDGSPDNSFDGDGKLTTDFDGDDIATSVNIQSDGKIVVSGYSSAGGFIDFALTRYNIDGSLDISFDGDGKSTTDFGDSDYAWSAVIQGDGKIVLVGQSNNDFGLVRYNIDGTLDISFDGDGKLTTDIGGDDLANSVAVQSDGKIIAAGKGSGDFALVRYNSDGTLDNSFDIDGKLTTDFGGTEIANSVTIQSDGKIVAVGDNRFIRIVPRPVLIRDFALARYNNDGSLDNNFDGDGKLTTDIFGDDYARSVALQNDGKLVVAGEAAADFALARYDNNGNLDNCFDGDGKLRSSMLGGEGGFGIRISGNRIYIAGFGQTLRRSDFILAAYQVQSNVQISCLTSVNASTTDDGAGNCTTTVSLGLPTVNNDNCHLISVKAYIGPTEINPATYTFPAGQTTITWNATDDAGNTAQCDQSVTVTDNELPVAICKPVTVTLANGQVSISVSDINNGSTDNCGIATMTLSKTSFDCSNIGANNVTLTVRDLAGNVSTCTSVVTVTGVIPTCTITAIPSNNVYTGGIPTNIYLGYGPQSVRINVNPSGGSPFTYAWTGNGALSNYTLVNPVFAPIQPGNYSFTVVVTNKYGCTTSCSISICVKDIRVPGSNGQKVYLCHAAPGNSANKKTKSLLISEVPSHLNSHASDRLGRCEDQPCPASVSNLITTANKTGTTEMTRAIIESKQFGVQVWPNPSASNFRLALTGSTNEEVVVKVVDVFGRRVQTLKVPPGQDIRFGDKLKNGLYLVEVKQGESRRTIKIVKQ